jgi:V8-like Glu-specific endopeptidase
MAGIPPNLLQEMRRLMLDCQEFQTGLSMQTLFVDARLHPFANSLPSADNRSQNVDNVIYHLHNRFLRDGSSALVTLITILAQRYGQEYLGDQLRAMADRCRIGLSNTSIEDAERFVSAATPDETIHEVFPQYEQIIGTSSLKNIMWLQSGIRAAQCVCRLLLPSGGRATGFLIADTMLLTNNHVIPNPDTAVGTVAEFNYQIAYDGNLKLTARYQLDASLFKTSVALDYTLVGVHKSSENPPLSNWGYAVINTRAEPVPGEHLVIIQHPGGETKQIAMNENYVKSVSAPFIRYTTDTRPGSSGAPVFNDSWHVVAVHHRSVTEFSSSLGRQTKVNEGVLLSHITHDAGQIWP